jgi:NADPH:quinone reductase-like Zn-dependent oxidoreductase
MRAAIFRQHGGPEVLEIAKVAKPKPGPDQVLIAIQAAALNHLDLWTRRGLPGLDFQFPHIGGSDIAGTVADAGERVDELEPGTRVLVNPSLWCGHCEWCHRYPMISPSKKPPPSLSSTKRPGVA